jgi:mannosyltransferase
MLVAVLVRCWSASPLWLDEAISVNIAKLPSAQLFAALRQDGSPPAYYLALHLWIRAFGLSDEAVRSLSVCFSVASLAVVYALGHRIGGRGLARTAALVLGACPFAVRYATETRMYSMLILLSLLGILLLLRAADRPSVARLLPVTLVSGLLALTHYWSFFLLAVAAAILIGQAIRRRTAVAPRRQLAALLAGAVLFAPWLPTFFFQLRHTGTPWAPAPQAAQFLTTMQGWWGSGTGGMFLYLLSTGLIVVGLLAKAPAPESGTGRRVESPTLVLHRPRSGLAAALAAAGLATLALGLLMSFLAQSGYALRYSAVALPPVILLIALGLCALPRRARGWLTITFAMLGLLVSADDPFQTTRTQAAQTASALRPLIGPGDLVVYCPDQLGPAVSRLLPDNVAQVSYPSLTAPQRVDWVDYARRNAAASPSHIAALINARTSGSVWLVRADNYRTFGDQCAELDRDLTALRLGRSVLQSPDGRFGEPQWLVRFRPSAG